MGVVVVPVRSVTSPPGHGRFGWVNCSVVRNYSVATSRHSYLQEGASFHKSTRRFACGQRLDPVIDPKIWWRNAILNIGSVGV